MPPGGLNIRWPDAFLEQEARLLDYKVYAALAYCRANRLDRIVWDSPKARFGIVTTGKSFGDTLQALADLGIDEHVAADAGIRLYKVAMSWPLEPQGARRFAEGLEEILVVEEKRQVIEYQIKEELYNWREGTRAPRVVGKFDDNGEWSIAEGKPAGNWLLPAHYELSAALIAKALAGRFAKLGLDRFLGERLNGKYGERLAYLEFKEKALAKPRVVESRLPGSAATSWRSGWTATLRRSRTWAPKARPGSGRRRSPNARTCSPTSGTALTFTRGCSRFAQRWQPA
jgi:indolepyruvate ferredoxin oxidoreductase